MGRPRTRWFRQLLEDIKKGVKELARNRKGNTVGRKKRLQISRPSTRIKRKRCSKKKKEKQRPVAGQLAFACQSLGYLTKTNGQAITIL
jgi:hypothetical protein